MPTVAQILAEAKNQGLRDVLAGEMWLGYLLNSSKENLFSYPEREVSVEVQERFFAGVKEMLEGKPVGQLIGSREFYGLNFFVNGDVLIPRPESELLVDLAKRFIDENLLGQQVTVADIGTGSGCILLALLKNCSEVKGIGVEVSDKALDVARRNAEKLDLDGRVKFFQGNLLEPLVEPCQVILANLPYIGREKFHFVAENVAKFEPEVALFGGADGLDLYREMFAQLDRLSWKPAFLAGEFGFGQEEIMREVLAKYFPIGSFDIIPDLAGIPRVFVVR